MVARVEKVCNTCGSGNHSELECEFNQGAGNVDEEQEGCEEAFFTHGGYPKDNPPYNPNNRNHPNFSYRNPNNFDGPSHLNNQPQKPQPYQNNFQRQNNYQPQYQKPQFPRQNNFIPYNQQTPPFKPQPQRTNIPIQEANTEVANLTNLMKQFIQAQEATNTAHQNDIQSIKACMKGVEVKLGNWLRRGSARKVNYLALPNQTLRAL